MAPTYSIRLHFALNLLLQEADVYPQNAVVHSRLEIDGHRVAIRNTSKPEHFAVANAHQNAGVVAVTEFREINGTLAFDRRITGDK